MEIEKIIKNTTKENQDKVNWTKAWSKEYPVLATYQHEVNIKKYRESLRELLESLKMEYNYSEMDAMLVLKDILAHEWRRK